MIWRRSPLTSGHVRKRSQHFTKCQGCLVVRYVLMLARGCWRYDVNVIQSDIITPDVVWYLLMLAGGGGAST